MRWLILLCVSIYIGLVVGLDCSDVACIALYEDCESQNSCESLAGCCRTCCSEPCVECLVAPCEGYVCSSHPEYECREDYCGGCNRNWFDQGVRVECEEEIFGEPIENPCETVRCAAPPEAEECEGCGLVYGECCVSCCESPCVDCFMDPCQGYSCAGEMAMECRANYCGGCNREWFDSEGQHTICELEIFDENPCALVDCIPQEFCSCGFDPEVAEDSCCPTCCPEEECVNCFVDPCEGYSCEGFPGYQCNSNYCGGCNRLWTDSKGNSVECENELLNQHPCAAILCAAIDPSSCSCGIESSDSCCQSCCPEEQCVQCFEDPCDNWSCFAFPGYECRANYCGGCNRDWFDSEGSPVECPYEIYDMHPCATVLCAQVIPEDCSCGIDLSPDSCCPSCCPEEECVECFTNPCDGFSCTGFPGYECKPNYCGGCNREWVDSLGYSTYCEQETTEDPCAEVDCIDVDQSTCPCGVIDPDLCCSACCECTECLVNPCDGVICLDDERYVCEANYCGGCNRYWLNEEGNEVYCYNESNEIIEEPDNNGEENSEPEPSSVSFSLPSDSSDFEFSNDLFSNIGVSFSVASQDHDQP